MLSACKDYFRTRWLILRTNAQNTYEIETAYLANRLGYFFGTLVFTLAAILFVNVIFANVRTFAGYTRDEMLLLILLVRIVFNVLYHWSEDNVKGLIEDVNRGNLDLILVKPVPALFYVSLRKITLISLARDTLTQALCVALAINWHALDLQAAHVAAAALVLVCGIIANHVLEFLLGLPVFWSGEAAELYELSNAFAGREVPYEGFSPFFRFLFTTLIPVYLATAFATSVLLDKSPIGPSILFALTVAAIAIAVKAIAWRFALQNYTSASS